MTQSNQESPATAKDVDGIRTSPVDPSPTAATTERTHGGQGQHIEIGNCPTCGAFPVQFINGGEHGTSYCLFVGETNALRSRVAELEAALRLYADEWRDFPDHVVDRVIEKDGNMRHGLLTYEDALRLRVARDLLSTTKGA